MLGFFFGLIVGGFSGGFTYHSTHEATLATVVGLICFFLAWLIGLWVFTDGDFGDLF
jgi:hypothetical protein